MRFPGSFAVRERDATVEPTGLGLLIILSFPQMNCVCGAVSIGAMEAEAGAVVFLTPCALTHTPKGDFPSPGVYCTTVPRGIGIRPKPSALANCR